MGGIGSRFLKFANSVRVLLSECHGQLNPGIHPAGLLLWRGPRVGILVDYHNTGILFRARYPDPSDNEQDNQTLSWLLDSSIRYFGIFDANLVRSRLCLLTGPTLNDVFMIISCLSVVFTKSK